MKPTMSNLKRIAAKFGGVVEVDNYDGDHKAIQIVAPDGKQWADGDCVNMCGDYWLHATTRNGGTKEQAIEYLIERIQYGLRDYNEDINS